MRDRKEDVELLSNFFFEKFLGAKNFRYQDDFKKIMEMVKDHEWHGNVRELENFVERISVLLQYHENPNNIERIIQNYRKINVLESENENKKKEDKNDVKVNLQNKGENDFEQWEINKILNALKKNNLSIQNASDSLGISRTTLWRKMKKHGIKL